MTTTDNAAPDTGEIPAGAALLAELADDQPPTKPTDPAVYTAGCHISALGLHIPAGLHTAITVFSGHTLVDVEIKAVSPEAAAQIADALPWDKGCRRHSQDTGSYVHWLHDGVLFDTLRVRVAGLEARPGGDLS